jgi:uridine monophosphate synthetase
MALVKINEQNIDRKSISICGIPYSAIPIASVCSITEKIPLIIRKKETKNYGTCKNIEGNIKNRFIVIFEDVISTGSSVIETIEDLRQQGGIITIVCCILDRQMGGKEKLQEIGVTLQNILTNEDLGI